MTGSRYPGPTPGVRGVGRVTGEAAWLATASDDPADGEQFWLDSAAVVRTRFQVPVDIPIMDEADTIPRTVIKSDPRLASMEVIRTDASGRNPLFVTAAETDALLELAGGTPPALEDEAGVAVSLGDHGAGFGDPLTNRAVELAAMRAAADRVKDEGWDCEDVSTRKVGWDITARRGIQERHLEVKGVSGSRATVLLTRGEYRAAESDDQWELVVVIDALGDRPEIRTYDAAVAVRVAHAYTYLLELP